MRKNKSSFGSTQQLICVCGDLRGLVMNPWHYQALTATGVLVCVNTKTMRK